MASRTQKIKEALERHDCFYAEEADGESMYIADAEYSLKLFLEKKSMTGARIKDFPESVPMGFNWESIICSEDPDKAISDLWVKVILGEEAE